jgi:hypothetical protein
METGRAPDTRQRLLARDHQRDFRIHIASLPAVALSRHWYHLNYRLGPADAPPAQTGF